MVYRMAPTPHSPNTTTCFRCPAATHCWSCRWKSSIRSTCRNLIGTVFTSRNKRMRRVGIRVRAQSKRAVMKLLHTLPLLFCVTLLAAQGPAGGRGGSGAPAGPAAIIDFSGMWTGNMQEDNMERGAGPELVDYAGFPINEAGRLWALSYDPSRLTSRFHQCDGYVAPYSVRAIGNTLVWEERDPKLRTLIAIHWYSQTFEGHRIF